MTNKYLHRIESLKEHREDKEHKNHQKKKGNTRVKSYRELKKVYKNFQKKIEKSKKIW